MLNSPKEMTNVKKMEEQAYEELREKSSWKYRGLFSRILR